MSDIAILIAAAVVFSIQECPRSWLWAWRHLRRGMKHNHRNAVQAASHPFMPPILPSQVGMRLPTNAASNRLRQFSPPPPPKRFTSILAFVVVFWLGNCAQAQPLYVNGGELYSLRNKADFDFWYYALKYRIVMDESGWPTNSWPPQPGMKSGKLPAYMPQELRNVWPEVCSQGFGIFDRPFVAGDPDNKIAPEGDKALTTAVMAALNRADDYVWYFPECHNYLTNAPGRWCDAIAAGVYASRSKAKLILYGSFCRPDDKPKNTPQYLASHRAQLEKLPFDDLTVYLRTDEQTYDQGLCRKLLSSNIVKTSEVSTAIVLLGPSNQGYWIEVPAFMAPVVDDGPGWTIAIANMSRLSAAIKLAQARGVPIRGVFMDTEDYKTGWTAYAKDDLPAAQAKMFDHGQKVMAALDCPVITTVAPIYAMTEGHPYGKNYELYGAFVAGLASGVK